MQTATACGVTPCYLPPPQCHTSFKVGLVAINQLSAWQLRGVKYWVEREKTKGKDK